MISEKLEKEKNAKIAALKNKEKRHEEYINAKRQQEKKDALESKEKIKAKQIEAERRRLEELEKRKERAQVCEKQAVRSRILGTRTVSTQTGKINPICDFRICRNIFVQTFISCRYCSRSDDLS